jgi:hypothetical protein
MLLIYETIVPGVYIPFYVGFTPPRLSIAFARYMYLLLACFYSNYKEKTMHPRCVLTRRGKHGMSYFRERAAATHKFKCGDRLRNMMKEGKEVVCPARLSRMLCVLS